MKINIFIKIKIKYLQNDFAMKKSKRINLPLFFKQLIKLFDKLYLMD